MANDIWIGKKGFSYWYYRYRDSEYYSLVIIGITILVCFLLVMYIIVPEVSNWFSIRLEVLATRQRISVLQSNIDFIQSLNKTTLDSQLQTATSALPAQKDFGSMLDAISDAAATSGISLNDFAFSVGNVASSSAQLTDVRYKGLTTVQISFVANGSLDNVKRFIVTLNQRTPLSEVTNLDGSGQTISVNLQFFQKPIPKTKLTGDTPLQPLSAQKLALLQQIANWKTSHGTQQLFSRPASNSAIPLF